MKFMGKKILLGALFASCSIESALSYESEYGIKAKFENKANYGIDYSLYLAPNFTNANDYGEYSNKDNIIGGTITAFGKHGSFGYNNWLDNLNYMLKGESSVQQIFNKIIGVKSNLITFNVNTPEEGIWGVSFWEDDIIEKNGGDYVFYYEHESGKAPSLKIVGKKKTEVFTLSKGGVDSKSYKAMRSYNRNALDDITGRLYDGFETILIDDALSNDIEDLGNDLKKLDGKLEYLHLLSTIPDYEDKTNQDYYDSTGTYRDSDYKRNSPLVGENLTESKTDLNYGYIRDSIIHALKNIYGDTAINLRIYDKKFVYSNEITNVIASKPTSVEGTTLVGSGKGQNNESFNQDIAFVASRSDTKTSEHYYAHTASNSHTAGVGISMEVEATVPFAKSKNKVEFTYSFTHGDQYTDAESSSRSFTVELGAYSKTMLPYTAAVACRFVDIGEIEGEYETQANISGPVSISLKRLSALGIEKYKSNKNNLNNVLWGRDDYISEREEVLNFADISDLIKFVESKGEEIKNLKVDANGVAYIQGRGKYKGVSSSMSEDVAYYPINFYDLRDPHEICLAEREKSRQKSFDFDLEEDISTDGSTGTVKLNANDEGINRGIIDVEVNDTGNRSCKASSFENNQWKYQGEGNVSFSFVPNSSDYSKPLIKIDCSDKSFSPARINIDITRGGVANHSTTMTIGDYSFDDFELVNIANSSRVEYKFDKNNLPSGNPRPITIKVDTKGNVTGKIRYYDGAWRDAKEEDVEIDGNIMTYTYTPTAAAWRGETSFALFELISGVGEIETTIINNSATRTLINYMGVKPEPVKSFDITEFAPIANVAKIGFDKTNLPSEDTQNVTVKITDPNNNKCDVYRVAPELGSDYLKVGTGNITNTSSPVLEVLQGNRSLIAYDCYGKSNVVKTQPVKFEVTINGETVTKEVNIA